MLRRFCILASFSLFTLHPSWAQSLNAGETAELYKLEGRVVNSVTRQPVPHALVIVTGNRNTAMLTGPEGQFEFRGVPPGDVNVSVFKPGFMTPGDETKRIGVKSAATVTIPLAGKLELELAAQCSISGQITGNDDEPLEGVTIDALAVVITRGHRQLMQLRSATSDEDGGFRFGGLSPGRYYVVARTYGVSRRVLGASSENGRQAYPAVTYYLGGDALESATPVELKSGQRVDVLFSLKTGPAYKISGTVAGKLWQRPMLTDQDGHTLGWADKMDSESGTFEFDLVPPGAYRVKLERQREYGTSSQQPVYVESDVTGLALTLPTSTSISVLVRAEFPVTYCPSFLASKGDDCASKGAQVTLSPVDPSITLNLHSSEMVGTPPSLALQSIPPGRYFVEVNSLVGGYVYAVRSGATDLLREPLVVPSEGTVAPIEITLRQDGAKAKIHVNSDDPEVKSWVLLVPSFAPVKDPILVPVQANSGGYSNLAPGDYDVFAFDSLHGLEYANRDVLARYSAKAVHITLSAGNTTDVSVDLVHTEE